MIKELSVFDQIKICNEFKDKLKKTKLKYSLSVKTLNLMELYNYDINNHEGFIINPFDYSTVVNNWESALLGNTIFSEKFGVKSNDPESVLQRRFKCECGQTASPTANVKCPICGSYTQVRVMKRGWFVIKNYQVFNPFYLLRLIKYLPIDFKEEKEKKRIISKDKYERNSKTRERVPFEISLNYYDIKTKEYFDMLNLTNPNRLKLFINLYVRNDLAKHWLLNNMDKAYTNAIPVITKNLRHYYITGNSISDNKSVEQHPLNPILMHIDNAVDALNRMDRENVLPSKINSKLTAINKSLLKIIPVIFKETSEGKKSDLRNRINGRRVPNSFRNILEGISHFRSDACTISYRTFGVVFMEDLEEKYKEWGMTPESKARIMTETLTKTELVLMQKGLKWLRENHLNYVIMKRSPCILLSSILSFEIIGLTIDPVIRVNIQVLNLINGDKRHLVAHSRNTMLSA